MVYKLEGHEDSCNDQKVERQVGIGGIHSLGTPKHRIARVNDPGSLIGDFCNWDSGEQ